MRCVFFFLIAAVIFLPANITNAQDSLFAPAVNYEVGSKPYSVFAADLDGDNDLAVANEYSNNVSILFNLAAQTDIEREPAGLPAKHRLAQNYPNPFKVETKRMTLMK